MSRTRTRNAETYFYAIKDGFYTDSSSQFRNYEYFFESSYPGSNSCKHIQSSSANHVAFDTSSKKTNHYDNYPAFIADHNHAHWNSILIELAKVSSTVDWESLPSSTQFSIIQFVAELDDTLMLFTRKFWNSLSYGSITWGVLPFVADLKALLTTIKFLSDPFDAAVFETQQETSISLTLPLGSSGHYIKYLIDVTRRWTGFLNYMEVSRLDALLDTFGFHPDLATAWDLVPLSFVVDYILPIGDFLADLQGRGWVSSVPFTGWLTYHYDIDATWGSGLPRFDDSTFSKTKVTRFDRYYANTTLDIGNGAPDLKPEIPSLKQLFNMFYIAVSSLR